LTCLLVKSSSCTKTGTLDHEAARDLPCHTGARPHLRQRSALGRVRPDKSVQLVRGDGRPFGLRGRRPPTEGPPRTSCWTRRSASCRSAAGRTGKSALALCRGSRRCWSAAAPQGHRVRPLYAVGGRNSATCPGRGRQDGPWAQAVYAHPERGHDPGRSSTRCWPRDMFEGLPLTHIRAGRCTTPS